MKQESRSAIILPRLIHLLYLIFFASLFSPFRAINSISIGLLLLAGLYCNRKKLKWPSIKSPGGLFIISCILFFLLQIISLLYTGYSPAAWKNIQLKTGIALIPLAVYFSGYINLHTAKKLLAHYCLLLAAAILYCLATAAITYFNTGEPSVFFYYRVVSPLKQHAVYFSIYVLAGLVYLFEAKQGKDVPLPPAVQLSLAILFSGFLFLLSSKLVITFFLLYLVLFVARLFKHAVGQKKAAWTLATVALLSFTLLVFTRNPVNSRFRDLVKGNMTVMEQEQFTPGDYFNGIQFRLLQWKLTPCILNEQNSWWTGVGSAGAQRLLDQQYISRNMYTGDVKAGIRGYQGYNTHSQLLESLLKTGIPGLLLFLLICVTVTRIILHSKQRSSRLLLLLLLVYACIEAVFETQYGITLFTFFVSFICFAEQEPTFE